jgi:hypothetical protein
MSPAAQDPPELALPQQAPIVNVVKTDVVPSEVSAEKPPVEKKEKKDKKEKREKKRKSTAIEEQTVR